MIDFYEQVAEFIADRHLLPVGSAVVAGVSGGADSLALLLVLDRLRPALQLELTVAHLNHGLRGAAADADEAFVYDWCRRLSVNFVTRRTDVAQLAAQQGIGLEEAGRQARLDFFNELAAGSDAKIALAHHLDDQAETLLLHLGRGCGLDGLTGMKAQAGRVIRPFLQQPRRAIEDWLTSQDISWRLDTTNLEPSALRNRLRLQVLPVWTEALGYNPAPLLGRTAASLAEDQQLLDSLTRQALACCREDGLVVNELIKLAPALQSRVLRAFWLEETGSGRDLAFGHIQLLRDWLTRAKRGQFLCLPGNWHARLDGQQLRLIAAANIPMDDAPSTPVKLNVPGLTTIPHANCQIAAVLIENDEDIVYNNTTEYFHLDRIEGSVVRNRLPGDRIHPQGRSGGKTLKKFLNEQGIAPLEREKLLLVACGSEIVWLPGWTAGADFIGRPADGRTGRLVRLEILSGNPVGT